MRHQFDRFAHWTGNAVGHPAAFLIAAALVVLWAVSGPFLHFSEVWQLTINTATTIVTFLMVFVIQASQNRDTKAMQAKMDEILRAIPDADNRLIGVERER